LRKIESNNLLEHRLPTSLDFRDYLGFEGQGFRKDGFLAQLSRSVAEHSVTATLSNIERPIRLVGMKQRVYIVPESLLCLRIKHAHSSVLRDPRYRLEPNTRGSSKDAQVMVSCAPRCYSC